MGYDYKSSGSSSSSSSSSVPLTISGDLVLADNTTYQAGEFCLAGVFQGEDEWDKEVQEGEAVAVMCEPCKSEVLCSVLLLDLFNSNPRHTFEADERSFGTKNMVLVGDKNADGKVDFKEFKAGVDDYIKKVFNVLDKDEDGSLDKDVSLKSLSAKFFLQLLDEGFLFFDVNEDDIMSVEDAPEGSFRDWNDDGKISLREVFGVSLINLPAPLYRLYTKVDKDKNEKFSLEEATNFIKGTIYLIDQNEDCSINIDEVLAMLNEARLPSKFQLAVRILGEHFLTLGDFLLKRIVAVSDSNGDKKTSFDEILHLSDTSIIKEFANVVPSLGMPSRSIMRFMECGGRRCGPRESEAQVEMWLNVLYDIVDNRKFDSVPENLCGL